MVQGRAVHIGLLLIDGFALMSYASFVEPFRAANVLSGAALYRWSNVTIAEPEVAASNGARLLSDARVGDVFKGDLLLVFAGGRPALFYDEKCFAWLRRLARQGIRIGGVSGGPFVLAAAGLLENKRATVHWEHAAEMEARFPRVELQSSLFTIDDDRLTCAGGIAALDLALALIDADHGAELTRQVREWFIGAGVRPADNVQRATVSERYKTTNRRLVAMLTAMETAVESPVPRKALADAAGVSQRQLERLCIREMGRTMDETYMGIRLDHAKNLLTSRSCSITEAAFACGFRSASHFSRRFKRSFGMSPSRAGTPLVGSEASKRKPAGLKS
ncbi:GlxA family transcriptional regulator [Sphingomonas oligophenolica]